MKTKKINYKNKNKFTKKGGGDIIRNSKFIGYKMKERYNFCNDDNDFENTFKEYIKYGNHITISSIDDILGKIKPDKNLVKIVYPDFHGSITKIDKYESVPLNHILIFMTELNYSGIVDKDTYSNIFEYLINIKKDDIEKLLYTYGVSDDNKFNKSYISDNNIFMNCFKN